jgi:hypothetical protein
MLKSFVVRTAVVAAIAAIVTGAAEAATRRTYVSINTAPLVGHPAGPFTLVFSMTDGSGIGDESSTVTITAVDFGGGSAAGSSVLVGGATGTLNSGVAISDSSFLNFIAEAFTPGATLRFTLTTTWTDGESSGIPDRMAFEILDASGTPIPTQAPVGDVLFGVDLGSDGSAAEVYGSDTSRTPTGGTPLALATPTIVSATPLIGWMPSPLTYGMPLGPDQLNASANVPGVFAYTPGLGTLLPAGSHTLIVDFVPDDSVHFVPTTATVTLTVTPASLIVAADNAAREFGTSNPPFTAHFSGLRGSDTPGVLAGTLVFSTPATLASLPGTYPIAPSGVSSNNYHLTFVDGLLTVHDSTAPIIASHPDVTVEATSAAGAVVNYTSPATTDSVDGPGTAACLPTSGGVFALATTTVTCAATDAHGNMAAPRSFKVSVVDTTPPALTLPTALLLTTTGTGAVGIFESAANDVVDGATSPTCTPASGSTFPVGTTTVTCKATDSHSNTSVGRFPATVTVPSKHDGLMFGVGHVAAASRHIHLAFRVSRVQSTTSGRLEVWSKEPRFCSRDDDNPRGNDDGDHDTSYGRDHGNLLSRFESMSITTVTFSDDHAFRPGRPHEPTADTVTFSGSGRWNGRSGYTFEARATDRGKPGKGKDTFALVVKDSRGTVVFNIIGTLDGGNIQSARLTP